MLEDRVRRLEDDMKEVKASLKTIELAVAEIKHLPKMSDYATIKADVAEIKGKLSNLPTTWTLISFAIGSVLASAGLAFAIARLIRL